MVYQEAAREDEKHKTATEERKVTFGENKAMWWRSLTGRTRMNLMPWMRSRGSGER
jgi:hypothetical protein